MYRIIDKRGSGKTSRLFLLAKQNDATIVCSNPHAMEQKAHAYGLVGLNFISYHDLLNYRGKPIPFKYMIDELEGFMASWAYENGTSQMLGYSLSNED